jgi:DNA-binding transcriptional LysR family regulator
VRIQNSNNWMFYHLEGILMELRQLEYFVAVVEEASFTRAAARLEVTQPGVSAQIRQLERELGEALLERSGRAVRLTEAGAAVLPHARAALSSVASARSAVEELSGLVRGRVAVGMIASSSLAVLPALLAEFHKRHPRVDLTLTEATSNVLIDGLLGRALDLAIVGLAGTVPEGLECQVITDEPLVAAVGHGHPLATRAMITLDALRRYVLISLPRGTGLRTSFDAACAQAGFQPRIALEAGSPEVLAQLAARALGVAILPESVALEQKKRLHAIAIIRPHLRSRLEIAWRASGPASPAARALIAQARALLANRAAGSVPAP